MFRESYQRGLLTIFFSCGAKPLKIWDTYTKNGYVSKFLDDDIKSTVLEIGGSNVSTTYMICPKGKMVLGITMPFLVMIVKNLKKYFSFEVTILDDTGTRRRFRVSNFQSSTQILPLCTVMPIALSEGWNQIQFNLADFTRRAYQKQYVEVQKLKINANIRIRRIYFADRILPDDQLPAEYKLFIPLKRSWTAKDKATTQEPAALEKQPSAELKKTNSKILPSSELSKTAQQVIKTGSKEFEKSPSKILDTAEAPAVEAEVSNAVAEEVPDEAAKVPDATEEIPQKEKDLAVDTKTTQPTRENSVEAIDTKTTPPTRENSVEATTQTDNVTILPEAATEDTITAGKEEVEENQDGAVIETDVQE